MKVTLLIEANIEIDNMVEFVFYPQPNGSASSSACFGGSQRRWGIGTPKPLGRQVFGHGLGLMGWTMEEPIAPLPYNYQEFDPAA